MGSRVGEHRGARRAARPHASASAARGGDSRYVALLSRAAAILEATRTT